tara:strand:- start:2807 stop:3388 length:582 start_codon:yes stop_codon:yes gene_type:complete
MTFKNQIFDLTQEAEDLSKMMYNDKIIKCLVAPYHSFNQLETIFPFTKTTFLFPEREMNASQVSSFISMVVKSPKITGDIVVVTTSMNIITDMIHQCVRILTEGGEIVDCPNKTFAANIHDVRYEVLENPDHQLSGSEKNMMQTSINKIIEDINSDQPMVESDYDKMVSKIRLIGEPLIRTKLLEMAESVSVI